MNRFLFCFFFVTLTWWKGDLFKYEKFELNNQIENHAIAANLKQSAEFSISGPDQLCLYEEKIIGDFFGGGKSTDVFLWKIFDAQGNLLVEKQGGFQAFSYIFSEVGIYTVDLNIKRGGKEVFAGNKPVTVKPGAKVVLEDSYLLCGPDSKVLLTALDPSTPDINNYSFVWKNSNGAVIGNANSIEVGLEGNYQVEFSTANANKEVVCPYSIPVHVYVPNEYDVEITTKEICDGGTEINASVGGNIFGRWFYEKDGSGDRVLLGEGNKLSFTSNENLAGPGNYKIIFEVDNNDNQFCKLEESVDLNILIPGDVTFEVKAATTSCDQNDGVLIIKALTDLDRLRVTKDGVVVFSKPSAIAGEVIEITGLAAGVYAARAGLGPCGKGRTIVVPQSDTNPNLNFDITEILGESCNETGKVDGVIKIRMAQPGFPGDFKLYDANGAIIQEGKFNGQQELEISLKSGNYFFSIVDENGCESPFPDRIEVPVINQVSFTVPGKISICEVFEFLPETDQNLKFTLVYPDNKLETKSGGEPFTIDQAGEYTVLGSYLDMDQELCPLELTFQVTINTAVPFEPKLVSSDCFGNNVYEAELFGADLGKVDINWYNENDEIVGKERLLYPTSHGQFKLNVNPRNSESCPEPPKTFAVPPPIEEVSVSLTASPLCSDTDAEISIVTDYEETFLTKWISYNETGEGFFMEELEDQQVIQIAAPGFYEAVLYKNECEIGRSSIQVMDAEPASFEIPEKLIICQSFDLIPETELNLRFTLFLPNGEINEVVDGEPFTLTQEGEYTIISAAGGDEQNLCPITKTFIAEMREPLDFQPVLVERDCDGKQVFQADLFGTDPNEVDIFWFDENGDLVGNDLQLIPESYGLFNLEVRPKGSEQCPDPRIAFEVVQPVVELDLYLSATTLCFDSDDVDITLDTDFDYVDRIQWTYTDLDGKKEALPQFMGLSEITASAEGSYEVTVYNELGCQLGQEMVPVLRSTDDRRPEVEEEYSICSAFGIGDTIDPGKFSRYKWFQDNKQVSESSTFKPTIPGEYTLTVTSEENCDYSTVFKVIDECDIGVVVPTAIVPGHPVRSFMVYTSDSVDEVEIMVYGKWGDILFHCRSNDLHPDTSVCHWDGIYEGNILPAGSYAMKIVYRNEKYNYIKTMSTAIMVVD